MGLNKRLIDQAGGAGGVVNTENFNMLTWTGDGTSNRSFTGLGFQPDLVWAKSRSNSFNHTIFDSVRGAEKFVSSDNVNAERNQDASGYLTSFDSDGFSTTGGNPYGNEFFNYSGSNFIAWCFKGGGAAVSNTNGSITSQVSANPDAGFSIVKYTKTAGNTTVGHGLSQKPDIIFTKVTNSTGNWLVFTDITGTHGYLHLNLTNTFTAYASSPNASTFNSFYDTGNEVVNYCFHSVDGYQKVGSYSGTGTSNTITTGFQPRFVIIKATNLASDWYMIDAVRPNNKFLIANGSNSEFTASDTHTFTSTGFTLSGSTYNNSGYNWIYLAIA